jgi:hypothetical protein
VIVETDEGTFGRCRLHNKRQRLFFWEAARAGKKGKPRGKNGIASIALDDQIQDSNDLRRAVLTYSTDRMPIKQIRKFRAILLAEIGRFYVFLPPHPISSEMHGNIPRQKVVRE